MPDIQGSFMPVENSAPVIHAKDVGEWARQHLGYQPLKAPEISDVDVSENEPIYPQLRSVAIYGGAKSSFDLVHFFATLHRNDPKLHLKSEQESPIEVHWIIRDRGVGPAWMVPPMSTLPNGDTVASDKAASTRLLTYLTPCCYMTPKRLSLNPSWGLKWEGSWLVRLFHGNPFGRWWIRWFWRSVDQGLVDSAQYGSDAKMKLLRPENRYALPVFVKYHQCLIILAWSRVHPELALRIKVTSGRPFDYLTSKFTDRPLQISHHPVKKTRHLQPKTWQCVWLTALVLTPLT